MNLPPGTQRQRFSSRFSSRLSLRATIERRLLINYRMDPALAQSMLPAPLRVRLVDGSALAGICLIRLGQIRPDGITGDWLPASWGWRAENAAHRIAVERPEDPAQQGVYIPLRHSASWLPVLGGGRVFPGAHHKARFTVAETASQFNIRMTSAEAQLEVEARASMGWPSTLFGNLAEASTLFAEGKVAWSPGHQQGVVEGVRLGTERWQIEAAEMLSLSSSFFDTLPSSAISFDSALLMRNIPSYWSSAGTLLAESLPSTEASR
ncbi:DUF2071 domain-containing protein [Psychromicrobium lacuslunae]|uniref:DUF2071 domain-containing protein n=1 Tax=Psychromicrobium lacuslunae TaxID=1618207 RepID=UPI0012FE84EB|nr:DUF2071 domain-containing protein [Psychromicrobium lacuslunae]